MLCDLSMPGGGGLAVVDAVALVAPIVIFTVSESDATCSTRWLRGRPVLLKTTPTDELRAQLRLAAAGEPVFSPSLAAWCSASSGGWRRRPAATR